ncbi:MAG: DUF2922 domain-containing protein [Sarcina sp.]
MAAKVEKELIMVFKDNAESNISLSVRNVKAGVNSDQVKACMDTIIAQDIFLSKNGLALVGKVSAKVVDTTTTPHEFA